MSEIDFSILEDITHIGVSGSRYVPTPEALNGLKFLIDQLQSLGARFLHQGCCTGWDEASIPLAQKAGITVVGHPPLDERFMSEIAIARSELLWPYKDYHARDLDIAFESAVLLIGPRYPEGDPRSKRSGTWLTTRYARDYNTRVYSCDTTGNISDVTEATR